MNSNPSFKANHRTGFTLIELLIVIAIMAVVTAISLPAIRMLTSGDATREAAREVNLFIESARAEAAANGFGGIWIDRDSDDPNRATRLFKVRRPQRYTGDYAGAEAFIAHGNSGSSSGTGCGTNGQDTILVYFFADQNLLFEPDDNGIRGININDRVQFDNKGPWYIIQDICGDLDTNIITHPDDANRNAYICEVMLSTSDFSRNAVNQADQFNTYVRPRDDYASYRIERTPMISSRDSIELPKGTYINLGDSGFLVENSAIVNDVRGGGAEFSDPDDGGEVKNDPILIVFREDGSIDRVDYELNIDGTTIINKSQYPPTSLFLHIASDPPELDESIDPLTDLESKWIVLSRSSGLTITADVATYDPSSTVANRRAESRRLARKGQNLSAN